ncbi:Protein MEI2-like 6 [Linum perenne]
MTSNLNPNASPFTATSPAKLISSPPPLLPHQFYFPSSPTKLLLPPPTTSDNISPIIISSDVSPITLAAVVHYPDHHHYIYYYYFYYLHRHTLPAANCHGGYEISTPDGHHAVPDPPPPCVQLVEHEAGSPEAVVKRRMVVKKRKVIKRKKNMVITRRRGGGADDWKSSDESKKPAGGGDITRRRGGCADDWKSSVESKKTAAASAGGGDDQKEVAAAAATITSLMIRHIPNHFQRYNMLRYLDGHCAAENSYAGAGGVISEYDFFYLPIDFRTGLNLGYAFVNFTTAAAAARFRRAFDNYNWKVRDSGKICQVTAAAIQGRDSLVENFSNSRFRCHRDSYLPAVFIPPRGSGQQSELKIVGERITPAVKLFRPNGIYSPRKSYSIRIK